MRARSRRGRRAAAGAACVLAVAVAPRFAAAHGRPAAVSDIVAADEHGPRVVALSEGMAILVDSEWHFVCPAEFGGSLAPPALSADGKRTYVVGPSDLFALEPDGRVVALHRRDLARDAVLSLVTTQGRLFATRYLYGRTELWRVDDGSTTAIWQGVGVYSPLSVDASSLWLVTQAGSSARAVRLSLDGAALDEHAFTMDASSSVTTLLALPGALYATLVTSLLGSELLFVKGTDAGATSLMKTDAQISGPIPDGEGGAWIASSEQLYRVKGSNVQLDASGERFSSVGSYGATSYASLHTRLVELDAAGPGRVLFDLADLRPPLGDAVVADARDECDAQWLVFRGDLARAGVPSDGGGPRASSSGSTAPPASAIDASGGCAVAVAKRDGSPGTTPTAASLLVAAVACRRPGRKARRRRVV